MNKLSQLGSSRYNPFKDGLSYCNEVMARHPLLGGVAITGTKTTTADLIVQFAIEKKEWDPYRTLLFASFGCLYQGAAQYCIINKVIEPLFPGASRRAVLSKICTMNFIADPFVFLPTFYMFKELALAQQTQQTLIPTMSLSATVSQSLTKYRQNCYSDWFNTWSLWIPGHFVTYGLCPLHLRLPWIATLSFGYVLVLSGTRGALERNDADATSEGNAIVEGSTRLALRMVPTEMDDSASPARVDTPS